MKAERLSISATIMHRLLEAGWVALRGRAWTAHMSGNFSMMLAKRLRI